jgi:hypothetical protein
MECFLAAWIVVLIAILAWNYAAGSADAPDSGRNLLARDLELSPSEAISMRLDFQHGPQTAADAVTYWGDRAARAVEDCLTVFDDAGHIETEDRPAAIILDRFEQRAYGLSVLAAHYGRIVLAERETLGSDRVQ